MIYLVTYLVIYGPPLVCGILFYRRQKKKQEQNRDSNPVMLYLLPFIVFTLASLLWSGLLYGLAYFTMQ